jgi:hypothetical protein
VPSHIIFLKGIELCFSDIYIIYLFIYFSGRFKHKLWKNPENNLVTKLNILHCTNIVLAIHSCTK